MQIKNSNIPNSSIFILPPSFRELKKRLEDRKSDTNAAINKRMANARAEVQCYGEYDFVIVNDDIEKAIKTFEDIIFTKNYDSNKNLIEKILQDMLSY